MWKDKTGMDRNGAQKDFGDTKERKRRMKRGKQDKATISVRLTDEEHDVLRRLCALKKTSRTGYLTNLAANQAKKELLHYAVGEYLESKASLSELAKKPGWTCLPLWMKSLKLRERTNVQWRDSYPQ